MHSIFISGSNRGLGLEWVRQYSAIDWKVYATCRYPDRAYELNRLASQRKNIQILRMDVSDEKQIKEVASDLNDSPIDVLVNNAGVYFERWAQDGLFKMNYDNWEETFRINTISQFRVSEAFINHIAQSDRKLIVSITSHMGSIGDIFRGKDYSYRSSKAAVNMAMHGLSFELREYGIGLLLLHTGWAKTRMGGYESAPHEVRDSVSGMRKIIENFDMSQSGQYMRFDGESMPW